MQGPEAPAATARRRVLVRGLAVALLVLAALLPSWGTLRAPWIAEDATILGYVHREPPFADWLQPQLGAFTVPFWRPFVTTSWDVQEAWTGTAPAPLRAFNLACHVLAALVVALLARAAGAARAGALAAGLLAALFPYLGGTVTWIAGRTDGLSSLLLASACLCALRRRSVLAALVTFLACATKEFGFLAPGWVLVLAWARRAALADCIRLALPVLVGAVVALVWRRFALGQWLGGYPPSGIPWSSALAGATSALGAGLAGVLVSGALALAAGLWARTAHVRLYLAALLCGASAALLLWPLVTDGVLEAQNLRLLRVADLGLCLAAGAALGRAPREGMATRAALPAVLLIVLVGARAFGARQDARTWAEAARVSAAAIERARERADELGPSALPLLYGGFPATFEGAYALGYGVADRYRAPFPAPPRPVWPARALFPGAGDVFTPALDAQGFLAPEAGAPGTLVVRGADGERVRRVELSASFLDADDPTPRLWLAGVPAGTRVLAVLYTELGFEEAFLAPGDTLTVRELLAREGGGVTLGDALLFPATLGAARAFLELRALADGAVVATSDWIELAWTPDVVAAAR